MREWIYDRSIDAVGELQPFFLYGIGAVIVSDIDVDEASPIDGSVGHDGAKSG